MAWARLAAEEGIKEGATRLWIRIPSPLPPHSSLLTHSSPLHLILTTAPLSMPDHAKRLCDVLGEFNLRSVIIKLTLLALQIAFLRSKSRISRHEVFLHQRYTSGHAQSAHWGDRYAFLVAFRRPLLTHLVRSLMLGRDRSSP